MPLVGRLAADLLFDLVERTDPTQRFLRHRVGSHGMQVVYLPARVCHTGRFLDGAAAIQLGVAGERVGLQHANELGETLLRMLATSIGRVGKPDRCRLFAGAGRSSRT